MKRNRKILILFVLIYCSCSNSVTDLYSYWINKSITIPDDFVWTISATDTVPFDYNRKFKIVNYIDSLGCLSCKSQFPLWSEFVKTINNLSDSDISVMLFLNPRNYANARVAIKKADYRFPVCIDLADSLNKLNHFPSDERFHCFLLDENNKVILIGNPVQNSKIRELYIKTICERLGVDYQKTTEVPKILDLGTFSQSQTKTAEFIIPNNTQSVMEIDSIYTSCECTTAEIDNKVIHPKENAKLSVTYIPDCVGDFYREVYVMVKDVDKPLVYSIKGIVMQ